MGEIVGLFVAFVTVPKDVEAGLVAVDEFVIAGGKPTNFRMPPPLLLNTPPFSWIPSTKRKGPAVDEHRKRTTTAGPLHGKPRWAGCNESAEDS